MVIDASVWVTAFLPQDVHHAQSAALLRAVVAKGTEAYVPTLVLSEVAGAVARQTGDAALAEAVATFIQSQSWLSLAALSLDSARAASQAAATLRLRGADAVYVALAEELSCDLITLDREMKLRCAPLASIVNCIAPKDWLRLHAAEQ